MWNEFFEGIRPLAQALKACLTGNLRFFHRALILKRMNDMQAELQNHFLVAMPSLLDVNFSQAVIYLCAYNEEGAMGIIINRPILDINLGEVLGQMRIDTKLDDIRSSPVLLGGPVQPERGFIIHRPNTEWQSTLMAGDDIGVTSSQDILEAMAVGEGPDDAVVILGYTGWGPDQLEKEISDNFWLTAPADHDILFNVPFEERWRAAASTVGVDLTNLSSDVGHA